MLCPWRVGHGMLESLLGREFSSLVKEHWAEMIFAIKDQVSVTFPGSIEASGFFTYEESVPPPPLDDTEHLLILVICIWI